jgi:hypothetical protein
VEFETSGQTVNEDSNVPPSVRVKLHKSSSAPLASDLVLNVRRVPASTASTVDYTISPTQIEFPADSANLTTKEFNVNITQDGLSEPEERLLLALDPVGLTNDVVIGQPNTHVITIPANGWVHRFDFTQGTLGWTAQGAIETGKSWGQYVPGSGWEDSGEKANNPSDFHTQAAAISRSFPQRTLSMVKVVYDLQNADDEPSRGMMLGPNYFGYIYQLNIGNEINAIYTIPLNPPAVTNYVAVFVASDRGTPNSNPPNPEDDQGKGDVMIREVWLYGVPGETNPFL